MVRDERHVVKNQKGWDAKPHAWRVSSHTGTNAKQLTEHEISVLSKGLSASFMARTKRSRILIAMEKVLAYRMIRRS